jgi:hypothetical protein
MFTVEEGIYKYGMREDKEEPHKNGINVNSWFLSQAHACTYVCTQVFMCMPTVYICIHTCVYMYMYTHMCIYVYVYIYIHTYSHACIS